MKIRWLKRVIVWWNLAEERVKHVYIKTKLNVFILITFLVLMSGFALIQNKKEVVENVLKDSTLVGIMGTLLGAVVGGVMSLLGSVWVSRQQIKATTMMRRKNIIYIPLYDELYEVHNRILKDNPYPTYIVYKKGDQTLRKHPQYGVLTQVKNDARRLEIPPKLWRLLESLEITIHEYQEQIEPVEKCIKGHLDDVIEYELQARCTLVNAGAVLLSSVALGKSFDLFEKIHYAYDPHKEIDVERQKEIQKKFVLLCENDENIKVLKEKYNAWIQAQEDAIQLLEIMVKNINSSYEE